MRWPESFCEQEEFAGAESRRNVVGVLVMKGSPVRVRASALTKFLLMAGFSRDPALRSPSPRNTLGESAVVSPEALSRKAANDSLQAKVATWPTIRSTRPRCT
jgi:hypothetical protein